VGNRRRRILGYQFSKGGGGLYVPADAAGLVSVWDPTENLDDATLVDTYAGNNGAEQGDVTFVADPPVCQYNGTTDWFNLGGSGDGSWADITEEITLVFVIKPNDSGQSFPAILMKGGPSTTQWQYTLSLRRNQASNRGARFHTTIGGVSKVHDVAGLHWNYGEYSTLAATFKTGEQKLFVNGARIGATATHAGSMDSMDAYSVAIAYYAPDGGGYGHYDGELGVGLMYSDWKSEAGIASIHNDIAAAFPSYSLAAV
jgi:hypothetical protein